MWIQQVHLISCVGQTASGDLRLLIRTQHTSHDGNEFVLSFVQLSNDLSVLGDCS
jgi:hypothetical protein